MSCMYISNARLFVASAQNYHRQNFSYCHLATQMVKNPHAMQETWVQFLGHEDTLEKGMATHSSLLAWRIPWAEEPGELQSMGLKGLNMTK